METKEIFTVHKPREYSLLQLQDEQPIDLLIRPLTKLKKDTIWVKVTIRMHNHPIEKYNNRPFELLEWSDFNTVNSNVKNAEVVCVLSEGNGIFQLTIRKNTNKTPISLSKGDYVDLNISVIMPRINSAITAYASGVIRIEQT